MLFTTLHKYATPVSFVHLLLPEHCRSATCRHAWTGRIAIVLMAVVGTLPLLAGPSALDATTISGTMVVGLGPPVFFLTFIRGYRPLVFHLSFWTGVAFGIVMQLVRLQHAVQQGLLS